MSPGSEEEKSSRGKAFIDPAAFGVSFARKSLVLLKTHLVRLDPPKIIFLV